MKKIVALILALVMCTFALTSCDLIDRIFGGGDSAAVSDLEKVKEAEKLVVGVTVYPPMDYVDENGEWNGFDAVLAKMFAEKLGVNCQIVIIDWNNKVAELNSNQIDLIWNGMTASEELGEKIDFSVSYAKNAQVAVVLADSDLTADDVKDATVAVENGSAGEAVATDELDIHASKLVEKSDGQVSALTEVLSGNAQVAIVDITMAQSLVGKGQYADLKILEGASYGDEIFAVGLRKGSDLKAELDSFLKELYKEGVLTSLAEEFEVGLNTEALSN